MKFRKPLTIMSRTSSVTNGFVQAIIPSVEPTTEEVVEALAVLGMTLETVECIYCGAAATDWDHLQPLVRKKRPTGYINEIRNLVPACGPCNQSKSGADWHRWIQSSARNSPRTKGIPDLADRIERLQRFVAWGKVEALDLCGLAGAEAWAAYWEHLGAIERAMKEAQTNAVQVQKAIRKSLETRDLSDHEITFDGPEPVVEEVLNSERLEGRPTR